MKLDGSKESGYLTKQSLAVIAVVAVVLVALFQLSDSDSSNGESSLVPLTLNVTVAAESIDRLGTNGCDLSGYHMHVESSSGYEYQFRFREGTSEAGGDCTFSITRNVRDANRYHASFVFQGGEWGPKAVHPDSRDGGLVANLDW